MGDRTLTFDFAGGLVDDNLLLADRETNSVWSQLEGKAISGPLVDSPLVSVPSLQTTWAHWRKLHPDTRVMMLEDEEGRPYRYRDWIPGSPRPSKPPAGHDTSVLGLGLVAGGEATFLPLRDLAGATTPLTLELGGRRFTVHYAAEAPTAWAEDADGELVDSVLAYEWAWKRFFPDSQVGLPD